jgi:hypothetical protein
MKRHILVLTALAALGFQTSCYPVKAYKLRENENITLGYIELDDNGELFERNELNRTIRQIYTLHRNAPGHRNRCLRLHSRLEHLRAL